jgi:uncharacterized protein
MNKTLKQFLLALFFGYSLLTSTVFASEYPAVPSLTGPVVDQVGILSPNAQSAITSALMNLNQESQIQYQVLIVDSLKDDTIEGFSIRVVDEWKIGKKGEDKAALLLIAINDKKMRIEVGRGLEGELTDLSTRRIIEEMKPYFKKMDFDNGVALGLSLMAQKSNKTLKFSGQLKPRHKRQGSGSLVLFAIFGLIFFLQMFFPSSRRRGFGSGGFGGFGGGGGGFGGGGSSGGGWSGGGGGFSGGGSSGNW